MRRIGEIGFQMAVRLTLLFMPLLSAGLWGQSQTTAVPHLVKFSGVVKDATGKTQSGIVGITFALYKEEKGGSPLWLETQNLLADAQGRYTVQ